MENRPIYIATLLKHNLNIIFFTDTFIFTCLHSFSEPTELSYEKLSYSQSLGFDCVRAAFCRNVCTLNSKPFRYLYSCANLFFVLFACKSLCF